MLSCFNCPWGFCVGPRANSHQRAGCQEVALAAIIMPLQSPTDYTSLPDALLVRKSRFGRTSHFRLKSVITSSHCRFILWRATFTKLHFFFYTCQRCICGCVNRCVKLCKCLILSLKQCHPQETLDGEQTTAVFNVTHIITSSRISKNSTCPSDSHFPLILSILLECYSDKISKTSHGKQWEKTRNPVMYDCRK